MTVTYPLDDDDLPFESANEFNVKWDYVISPEFGRVREPDPWVSHDWTNDYDYPDDYCSDEECDDEEL